jgi:glucose/mannose-6-phosphate isomerase
MGGSALPADVIKNVFHGSLAVPFSFVNGYSLPSSVGKKSLVVLSSYSGTTEEVLSCAKDAVAKKAKIMGITSGGALAKFLKQKKVPAYVFNPTHNLCGQPRMGIGYMLTGLIALLHSARVLKINTADLPVATAALENAAARWSTDVPTHQNEAKLIAQALRDTVPVIVAAEHLIGNGHILQNQIHESPKQFCAAFPFPELNHHLMEGLSFPTSARATLAFFFIGSSLYGKRIAKRIAATKKVLSKQGYGFNYWEPDAKTPLGQVFETLAFGSWVSFYMAIQNRADPSNIPWVDFFKKELARG